ncbi:unnamed protein product [Ectocarpus sp. 8 AP-2014]
MERERKGEGQMTHVCMHSTRPVRLAMEPRRRKYTLLRRGSTVHPVRTDLTLLFSHTRILRCWT